MNILKFLLPSFLFLVTGCFHKATPVSDNVCGTNLALLRDGHVTKDEILKDRGEPSYSYKNGRIIIYEISPNGGSYQLVLVFDDNYILSRHSCIKR
jgi:hypothetical protein